MNKKTFRKPINRLLIPRNNYFANGDQMDVSINTPAQVNVPDKLDASYASNNSNTSSGSSSMDVTGWGGLIAKSGSDLYNMINEMKGVDMDKYKNNIQSTVKGTSGYSYDNVANSWNNYVFGKKFTAKSLGAKSGLNVFSSALKQGAEGAAAGASLGGWGILGGTLGGVTTSLFGSLFGNSKRKKQAAELNEYMRSAEALQAASMKGRLSTIGAMNMGNMKRNITAFGGGLDIGGALGYDLANRYVGAKEASAYGYNKTLNSLPNMSELPVFANGGTLNTNGIDFSNGVTYIDNGGTHEENPYGGVPMGADSEGNLNLVEENEIITDDDYVLSNRVPIPDELAEKYGLEKGISFAEAAKIYLKESEERPNDPISKRSRETFINELKQLQELTKQQLYGNQNNSYAFGGNMFGGDDNKTSQMERTPVVSKKFPTGFKHDRNWINKYKNLTIEEADALYNYFLGAGEEFTKALGYGDIKDLFEYNDDGTLDEVATRNNFNSLNANDRVIQEYLNRVGEETYDDDIELPELIVSPKSKKTDLSLEDKLKNGNKYVKEAMGRFFSKNWVPDALKGVGLLGPILGLALNKRRNYTDGLETLMNNIKGIDYTSKPEVIGNYVPDNPLDVYTPMNELNSSNMAALRALGNNPAAILANSYNHQINQGKLAAQLQDEAYKRKINQETFNRTTNMFNAEAINKDRQAKDALRMQQSELGLRGASAIASLNSQSDLAYDNANQTGIQSLFDTLVNYGIEIENRQDYNRMIGSFGYPGSERFKRALGGKIKRTKKKKPLTL